MKSLKQIVVTKSDGTLERFNLAKLANCLATVMGQCANDPRLAGPLSKAVAMHLQEWRDAAPPTTNYVYRCVRSVLQQTGLEDVADLLAAHRRERRLRRARVRVVDPASRKADGEPWRKAPVIVALQQHFGVGGAVARFLAGRVERQVFALDYRLVSRAFLWELIRNEVLAWGLADERVLHVQRPVDPAPVPASPRKEES